mgnify:CR=1 FL=1
MIPALTQVMTTKDANKEVNEAPKPRILSIVQYPVLKDELPNYRPSSNKFSSHDYDYCTGWMVVSYEVNTHTKIENNEVLLVRPNCVVAAVLNLSTPIKDTMIGPIESSYSVLLSRQKRVFIVGNFSIVGYCPYSNRRFFSYKRIRDPVFQDASKFLRSKFFTDRADNVIIDKRRRNIVLSAGICSFYIWNMATCKILRRVLFLNHVQKANNIYADILNSGKIFIVNWPGTLRQHPINTFTFSIYDVRSNKWSLLALSNAALLSTDAEAAGTGFLNNAIFCGNKLFLSMNFVKGASIMMPHLIIIDLIVSEQAGEDKGCFIVSSIKKDLINKANLFMELMLYDQENQRILFRDMVGYHWINLDTKEIHSIKLKKVRPEKEVTCFEQSMNHTTDN